ncbi:hypothetical protein AYO44_00650 [Planctomycetaceae bacterium SCGC AG-212-F19]|nr:hypothetical protein AYO44_00650 [Planctomycetaceae bacterium SCGC AG-212-F19]
MNARKKVLLIGWDAADWKVIHPLLDAGKMPNLERLVAQGTMGQIATLHPPLSPMLWTSIGTGKRPFQHGIHGFTEPTPDGIGIQPVTNLSRRCKAVWNILNQSGLRSIVVGWWPSHPAEPLDGVMVSDHYHRARGPLKNGWPLLPGSVHPPALHETLAELRFHPDELVGPMIDFFVPRARDIDQTKDRRLVGLATTLCECVSIHSAATWLLDNQPWDFFAVYYDAIDHFCHGYMKYHPPRQDFIPEKDFEIYQNVVSAAYRFHDEMLGTLLQKAGPETTVVLLSDHGFHPDHLRPRMIPAIPAGPAIEHRDFGILAMRGAGIKKDELLHGASVLDITPTVLTLYGLPVGADMDGKVLVGAFEQPPEVQMIPSWEELAGADGRHPPHSRLDPVAARESLEQLIALGYIARPNEDREEAVAQTLRELRYNLGESYQDAFRHPEALEIFRELHQADPDEQRYAVHRFLSCQALGRLDEMRTIVEDLDGRRRARFTEATGKVKEFRELRRQRFEERKGKEGTPPETVEEEIAEEIAEPIAGAPPAPDAPPPAEPAPKPEPLLTKEERQEFARWQNLCRFDPPVVDYLKAQVCAMEGRHTEALDLLQRVQQAQLARPGLFLQTADLYLKLRRWDEAEQTYAKALGVDPDNPHAHLGMCRMALRRRDFAAAAGSALEALQRLHHYPLAHFFLGMALIGMRQFARAAEAFRAALALNPHFPEAHLRLAWLLRRRLHDPDGAAEHFRLYQQQRDRRPPAVDAATPLAAGAQGDTDSPTSLAPSLALPPSIPSLPRDPDAVIVVSGLPRSGTSMVMQMLAAGGVPVLTDGRREADADNPRGYFEYEPVKRLHEEGSWLPEARGKVIKIVAPLLHYLPAGQDYRIIFLERNLEEVLASQKQMLLRRGEKVEDVQKLQSRSKDEYARQVRNLQSSLPQWARTHVLWLNYADVIQDPQAAAESLNRFLGGELPVETMAAEVKESLHRQRRA